MAREAFEAAAHHHGFMAGQGALPPDVVADAAAWLVSDGAYAVTGQAVAVDSGHLILPGFNPAPVR
jgi:enoyl-[acyl-carrier-protein] reductase (NADH)